MIGGALLERALVGAVIAAGIALAARRARSLSGSGVIAATVLGTIAIAAGWGWGALLIAYFVASSLVTRWGAAFKAIRTSAIVEKGGARDAWQVVANGGLFGLAALGALALPDVFGPASAFTARIAVSESGAAGGPDYWSLIGAGALAAAAADTWSTEVGSRLGGTPRSIISGKFVPAGTSGGITLWGSAGAVAGGVFVALVAALCGWRAALVTPIAVAGIVGAFADSVLGATVQSNRRCPTCDTFTERAVHDCGTRTAPVNGWRRMSNDSVNLAATVVGAAAAVVLARG